MLSLCMHKEWSPRHIDTKKDGFTIVELLIVVVVIAILAAITIVSYNGIQNRAKQSAIQSSASQAGKKLLAHAIVNAETLPTDLASVGITDSGATTYKYVYDSSVKPNLFCVSATQGAFSYAATSKSSQTIEGQCVNNSVYNPSFETNTSGWAAAGSSGSVLTRVTTESYSGGASLQVATNGAAVQQGAFNSSRGPAQPNTTYTASVWIKAAVGRTVRIELGEWDSAPQLLNGSSRKPGATITGDGTWQRHTVEHTTGATAATADIVIRSMTSPAHTFYIDGVMLSEGSAQLAYGDGNSVGWSWSGAANNTTSLGPTVLLP